MNMALGLMIQDGLKGLEIKSRMRGLKGLEIKSRMRS
jgi:hypothetical protein